MQQLFDKRKLDDLEWMATLEGKSEEILLAELAQQDEAFHFQLKEALNPKKESQPKIELIDDETEIGLLSNPDLD